MRDEGRLQDIHAYGTIAFDLAGAGVDAVERDPVKRLALERALFIVGEAAGALSPTARSAIKQPWKDIIGLRNVLAHGYDAILAEQLVLIAKNRIPPLLAAIAAYRAGSP